MSRILAQPIYRDALLFGKFLAGVATLTVFLTGLWLFLMGLGILLLGVPPSGEEILRGLGFLVAAIAYGGVWLALALLFSIVFRAPATAALAALSLWLLFTVFWAMIEILKAATAAYTDGNSCWSWINDAGVKPVRIVALARGRSGTLRPFEALAQVGRPSGENRPDRRAVTAAGLHLKRTSRWAALPESAPVL
jgi:hypothetical protein